ncbi:DUF2515 family protein [Evansella sp. AB-P1]|uniref:DUF2515 family protein n=1 Tax=Evansella sp. AB-P1 TaxID=3037653 RepID=UPI00241FCA6D|nr:DUF2515 family protein [Evansella sp. AB-P1]MDG5790104.1 DUF2515 family protein [Evansella sp. AB-P1]
MKPFSVLHNIFFKKTLPSNLKKIKRKLVKKQKKNHYQSNFKKEDHKLVHWIKSETNKYNKNNITRTQAYLDYFQRNNAIHWAFLAHMVSRNAGWNMTDLKGELLSRLFSSKEQSDFFTFLERGNWLIFQDAYPQLLLYEESVNRQTNLFHLLPFFNVSIFMEIIWNEFFETRNHYLLTVALIINEQHYIEERLIKNSHYQQTVLNTLEFKLHELLSLNQLLFPFRNKNMIALKGKSVNHFSSLHERIMIGKGLYNILLENKNPILSWSLSHPHTGSRKDYWPHLFHDVNEAVPGKTFKRRLKDCKLIKGANKIYSPKLKYAWKDLDQVAPNKEDWYRDWKIINYLIKDNEKVDGNILSDYCHTLEKIQFAILTKDTLNEITK